MASVKPGTGELLAMYGGPDYLKSQLNWATSQARPGSSFKPFAVAAALKDDGTSTTRSQGDSPIEIQGQELNNEFDNDYGPVKLKKATEQSINTAFYDLVDKQMEDGPTEAGRGRRGGRHPEDQRARDRQEQPVDGARPRPVRVAGRHGQRLRDLRGERPGRRAARDQVESPTATARWSGATRPRSSRGRPSTPRLAKKVNDILKNVVDKGTGEDAKKLDREVAGKTGTAGGVAVEHRAADKKCDGCLQGTDTLTSWWTGYTPNLSTSVLYRAGKNGESDLDPYSKDEAFFGGNWPLKTWLAFMEPAVENLPDVNFDEPADDDGLQNEVTPSKTPSKIPTSTPTNTPSGPPTNTPSGPPTKTPTKTPTGPTNTPSGPGKPTKTPGWPTFTPPGDPEDPEKPAGGGQ